MKILLVDGNPNEESLSAKIAEQYYKGAKDGGLDIEILKLRDMEYNPNLKYGYSKPMDLETDLKRAQELIDWCDHLVIVTPYWWSGLPAILKGFIDRVFLPGFAFKFNEKGVLIKLLRGRSARVIYTQGGPAIFSFFFLRDAFWRVLKDGILGFCGFYPVKRTYIDSVATASIHKIDRFLEEIYRLGKHGK